MKALLLSAVVLSLILGAMVAAPFIGFAIVVGIIFLVVKFGLEEERLRKEKQDEKEGE